VNSHLSLPLILKTEATVHCYEMLSRSFRNIPSSLLFRFPPPQEDPGDGLLPLSGWRWRLTSASQPLPQDSTGKPRTHRESARDMIHKKLDLKISLVPKPMDNRSHGHQQLVKLQTKRKSTLMPRRRPTDVLQSLCWK